MFAELEVKQIEQLRLIAAGNSLGEIAKLFSSTESTVAAELDEIQRVLKVHSRAQAIVVAMRRNLISTCMGAYVPVTMLANEMQHGMM